VNRKGFALLIAVALLAPMMLLPTSQARNETGRRGPIEVKTTPESPALVVQDPQPRSNIISPAVLRALGIERQANDVSPEEAGKRMAQILTGDRNGRITPLTPNGPGNSHAIVGSPSAPEIAGSGSGANKDANSAPVEPDSSGLPGVLNIRSALSAGMITTIGGINTQFSEVDLLADWDGREDMTADRSAKLHDFSPALPSPNFTLTRSAISEHTYANGHGFNGYYYGDSIGNLYFGFDLAGNSIVDATFQCNIPSLINTGTNNGFTLLNPTAGDCSDSSAIVTGIAVNPVADLGDFDAALCGITGEIIYVSTLETGGCASNAAGQPIRTRILAFAIFEIGNTEFVVSQVRQILRTPFANVAGLAVDDDGSLYFPLVDLVTVDPVTGLGGAGGAIFKATDVPRTSCTTPSRINRSINLIPTPTSINSAQGTGANPILIGNGTRLTNYSGPSPVFGNIASVTAGPNNVVYAALAASNTGVSDPTQGLFKAPAAFASGLPSMIVTFADVTGSFDSCATSIPKDDGRSDVAGPATTITWRAFVLGNGPDIRTADEPLSAVAGTTANTLKLDMQIDSSLYSGISVNEEGSVFVIAGGSPAGVGNNPSPNRTEILGFEDKVTADRRADFVDFRGDNLPNPPASGGNIGDGDSDRFDHIFYRAPQDPISLNPVGLAGLARGFLRYTNRLAPTAMGPSVTLGVSVPLQGDNSTDGTIIFENFDPGHQVAGGDDQNTPFRGDDNNGAGTPAIPGALNGGFEFSFGGPVGVALSTWNGFFLNSNGNITFNSGDTTATSSVSLLRSGAARIAGAWANLNPSSRTTNLATFPIQALGFANINAFKIRWINVPEVGSEGCTATGGGTSNTFSITLYDDGVGIDENLSQPLNPANPIGNNAVPFDQQEGPTDLRFTREAVTNAIIGVSPRRSGLGNITNTYGRMVLVGSAADPVLVGYSMGNLSTTNPPGLCETNLSEAARSAEANTFGVVQSQTANVEPGMIGEGTEPTIYEFFNAGTNATPEFDLRFEGNDPAAAKPVGQLDSNRSNVAFFGIGSTPPANPASFNGVVIPGPFFTTLGTTGLINVIGPVELSIIGTGFYPNEATTVCGTAGGESGPRAGKTVSTAVTMTIDVDGNSIPESTIALTNVQVISQNLIKATLSPAPGLPGSPFPLAASGGLATVTVTTTFTAGDNNAFGPFTRTASQQVQLGTRAPVVTQVTPSSGNCGVVQNLALTGGSFQFTQAANPIINATVTDVIATEIGNPANVIHATSFTVVDTNNLNATFNFGGASSRSFLIQAVGTGGTSRNMTSLPPGAPPPLGNEAGNMITFSCGGENLQFSAGQYTVTEDVVTVPVTIVRSIPAAGTITVDFATSDVTANQIGDYTATFRTVTFGPGEGSKVVEVPITEDAFVEGNEHLQLTLSNATGGASVGPQSTSLIIINNDDLAPAANSIDDVTTFVNQQYHDFFDRQGDAAGLAFWIANITSCGADPACIEVKRISTSGAFFLSIEFQETGFNVIRSQRVAFGKKSNDTTRYPYLPFLKDGQQVGAGVVIGQPGANALLEANKQAYATQIVTSPPFIAAYPLAQTATQFVDALFATATVTPTAAERTAAITAFGGGGTAGRTAAFRSVVDSTSVRNAEFNAAFVLMQYYGYLRRDPDEPGYQFWLTKLNAFGGDFIAAEMVKAFLSSTEYRQRFGTP
jgi:hypothetical protein